MGWPLLALTVVVAAAVALLGFVDRTARTAAADPTRVSSRLPTAGPDPAPTRGPSGAPALRRPPTPSAVDSPGRAPIPALAARPVAAADLLRRPVVEPDPVSVLTGLERIRATAFATGRVDLLARVYPAGGSLLVEDRALYARSVPPGGRLTGLGFDHRDPVVRQRTALRIVLDVSVTQQPVHVVSARGARRYLPARDLGRVRVVLQRAAPADAWRMAASTPLGVT